jgi:hypothetical protein
MSMAPGNQEQDADGDVGKAADAMKDQLKKDVASWSAARSASHSRDVADASVPVPPQPVVARPAVRAKRVKPPPAEAAQQANAPRKPFRMSYDGVTEQDYISYIIERGA